MSKVSFPVTGDPHADDLLVESPLALLIGMLLDQQVPIEWAFRGPSTLRDRLGTDLDATKIAEIDVGDLEEIFKQKPAIHRYPSSMARRTHALCRHIVDTYDGDAGKLWRRVKGPEEVFDRIRVLPGYGEEKSRIFLAILGKRLREAPHGWEAYAGAFADSEPRSVADIDSRESLLRVREWKKAQKAAKKGKAD